MRFINVNPKAGGSQLSLPHGTKTEK